MLRALRATSPWILLACMFAAILWASTLSRSYGECKASGEQQAAQGKQPNLKQQSVRFVVCEGVFLDTNREVVTAVATLVIAVFTVVLAWATSRQARLTTDTIALARAQLTLARDEFNATHRPRLRIRRIALAEFTERFPTAPLIDGQKIECTISIANVGDSPAKITHGRFRIYYERALPIGPDVFGGKPVQIAAQRTLIAGAAHVLPLADTLHIPEEIPGGGVTMHRLDFESKGRRKIIVVGNIWYEDGIGNARAVGFCRELHRDHRFRVIEDSEYEYED